MKRIRELALLILVGLMVFGGMEVSVWAGAAPEIQIDLRLDKMTYVEGEPVGMEVQAINRDKPLWISKGFSSHLFYFKMRVIDPAGRQPLAMQEERSIENTDAQPLPYVLDPRGKGKIVQVARCEPLPAEWSSGVQRVKDLGVYYDLSLPGIYSVRVQVSAMVFKGDLCDINDYEWKGVLRSGTKFFTIKREGEGEGVKVIPDQWNTRWRNPEKGVPDVQVQIWPLKGESVRDCDAAGILLNDVSARRVEVLDSVIRAYFDARAVFEKMVDVVVGKEYPVGVSFKKKGVRVYREQKVRVVNGDIESGWKRQ